MPNDAVVETASINMRVAKADLDLIDRAAEIAGKSRSAPGWRLVPEEPTREMVMAGLIEGVKQDEPAARTAGPEAKAALLVKSGAHYAATYRAMLSAASPSPRVPSEEEIARVIWIAGSEGRSDEDWQFELGASGNALEVQYARRQARAVLALFTPHQGEGK